MEDAMQNQAMPPREPYEVFRQSTAGSSGSYIFFSDGSVYRYIRTYRGGGEESREKLSQEEVDEYFPSTKKKIADAMEKRENGDYAGSMKIIRDSVNYKFESGPNF
jgi:hypothetical protein